MAHKLLNRDQFREGVFERDNHLCVICAQPAADAHHILERRLWPDGGYYLANGASLCPEHHIAAEKTLLSVEEIREKAGITKPIVPPHMYDDQVYDKWGNTILANGMRTRGELFFDESVQKVLTSVLDLFTNRVKYSRTHHVPWSDGVNSDDRVLNDVSQFEGQEVVVTEKMDGENTTMYSDYIHARSIDGRYHASRDWVKNFHSGIAHDIPVDWRVCGENMFAKHSIVYNNLESYFYGFSVWNDRNVCLSWDETLEWFNLLNIVPVPTLYRGIFDAKKIKELYNASEWEYKEGYIIRLAGSFEYKDFKKSVAKFVRKNHIQTAPHNWLNRTDYIVNELIKK